MVSLLKANIDTHKDQILVFKDSVSTHQKTSTIKPKLNVIYLINARAEVASKELRKEKSAK